MKNLESTYRFESPGMNFLLSLLAAVVGLGLLAVLFFSKIARRFSSPQRQQRLMNDYWSMGIGD